MQCSIIDTEDMGEKFSCRGRDTIKDFVCNTIFEKSGHGYRHLTMEPKEPFSNISYVRKKFSSGHSCQKIICLCTSDWVSCWRLRWVWAVLDGILYRKLSMPVSTCLSGILRELVMQKKEGQRAMLLTVVEALFSTK